MRGSTDVSSVRQAGITDEASELRSFEVSPSSNGQFAISPSRQHRRNREDMTSRRVLPTPLDRCDCVLRACLCFSSLPDRYDRFGLRSMSFFGNTQMPNSIEKKLAARSNSQKAFGASLITLSLDRVRDSSEANAASERQSVRTRMRDRRPTFQIGRAHV